MAVGKIDNCCECTDTQHCRYRTVISVLQFNGVEPHPPYNWGDYSASTLGGVSGPEYASDARENIRYLRVTTSREYSYEDGVTEPFTVRTATDSHAVYYEALSDGAFNVWKEEWQWNYGNGDKSRTSEMDGNGDVNVTGDAFETVPNALIYGASAVNHAYERHIEATQNNLSVTADYDLSSVLYQIHYIENITYQDEWTIQNCLDAARDMLNEIDLPIFTATYNIYNHANDTESTRAMAWNETLVITYEEPPTRVHPPVARIRTDTDLQPLSGFVGFQSYLAAWFVTTSAATNALARYGARWAIAAKTYLQMPTDYKHCDDHTEYLLAEPSDNPAGGTDNGLRDRVGDDDCDEGYQEEITPNFILFSNGTLDVLPSGPLGALCAPPETDCCP